METDIFSEMLWIESVSREEKILVLTQKLVPFSEVNHKRNHASVCTKDLLYKQLLDVFCIIIFFSYTGRCSFRSTTTNSILNS